MPEQKVDSKVLTLISSHGHHFTLLTFTSTI
jgi:hypothetical protein